MLGPGKDFVAIWIPVGLSYIVVAGCHHDATRWPPFVPLFDHDEWNYGILYVPIMADFLCYYHHRSFFFGCKDNTLNVSINQKSVNQNRISALVGERTIAPTS